MRFSPIVPLALAAVALVAAAVRPAHAQGMAAANAAFDQQFNRNLNNMMARNNDRMQQLWQYHLRQNGPRMQGEYRQFVAAYGRIMSYEQFAYYDMMTAGGTNVAAGMQAQRDQFNGMQRANQTRQSGYASYNEGWRRNSERATAAVENYSNQAILGYSPYVDPNNGSTRMLPYSLPAGQVYTWNGNSYRQDASGTFYQWDGNGWRGMQAGR